jgi:hypothetical protein
MLPYFGSQKTEIPPIFAEKRENGRKTVKSS